MLLLSAIAAASVVPFLLPPPIENPPEIVEIEVKEFKPPTWKCPDCTPEEKYPEQIQENTKIKDRNAFATIMGNIKQESKFISNICEEVLEFLTELAGRWLWSYSVDLSKPI